MQSRFGARSMSGVRPLAPTKAPFLVEGRGDCAVLAALRGDEAVLTPRHRRPVAAPAYPIIKSKKYNIKWNLIIEKINDNAKNEYQIP